MNPIHQVALKAPEQWHFSLARRHNRDCGLAKNSCRGQSTEGKKSIINEEFGLFPEDFATGREVCKMGLELTALPAGLEFEGGGGR